MKKMKRTKTSRVVRRAQTDTLKAALALRFATTRAIESSSSSSSERPVSPVPPWSPRNRKRSIVKLLA